MTVEPDPAPFVELPLEKSALVELPLVKPSSLDGAAADPPEPWEPLEPAAAGFRSDVEDRLDTVLAAGRAPDLHGLVVVRGGRLVLERYRTGEDFSWNWPHGVVAFGPLWPGRWQAAPRVQTQWGVDYGYQWYLGGTGRRRWAGAMGNGGQRLLVYPELDLVVAVTAGAYDGDPQPTLTAVVDDVVLASLVDP